MAKKSNKIQSVDYYSIQNLLQYPASYYVACGERSNGKTFSSRRFLIDDIAKTINIGNQREFVYLRRRHIQITKPKMQKLFEEDEEYAMERLGDYIKYSSENGFYIEKDGTKNQIGYALAVEDAFITKGIPFSKVKIVLFDEFLDYEYMQDEIEKFQHIISTITRDKQDVIIIMLGNTISRFCPYFDLLGIDVSKVKKGEIAIIKHKAGATIAFERCKNRVQKLGEKVKTHKYLGFDESETAKMILYGEWEYKEKETKQIDGIGWQKMRTIIPIYITALNETYEMSVYTDGIPVLFVRKINTQNGIVGRKIAYHLSYDDTTKLIYGKTGNFVPFFKKPSIFWGDETLRLFDIAKECVRVGRVVYPDFGTGTEFEKIFKELVL